MIIRLSAVTRAYFEEVARPARGSGAADPEREVRPPGQPHAGRGLWPVGRPGDPGDRRRGLWRERGDSHGPWVDEVDSIFTRLGRQAQGSRARRVLAAACEVVRQSGRGLLGPILRRDPLALCKPDDRERLQLATLRWLSDATEAR